jgi:hypothetical protein
VGFCNKDLWIKGHYTPAFPLHTHPPQEHSNLSLLRNASSDFLHDLPALRFNFAAFYTPETRGFNAIGEQLMEMVPGSQRPAPGVHPRSIYPPPLERRHQLSEDWVVDSGMLMEPESQAKVSDPSNDTENGRSKLIHR